MKYVHKVIGCLQTPLASQNAPWKLPLQVNNVLDSITAFKEENNTENKRYLRSDSRANQIVSLACYCRLAEAEVITFYTLFAKRESKKLSSRSFIIVSISSLNNNKAPLFYAFCLRHKPLIQAERIPEHWRSTCPVHKGTDKTQGSRLSMGMALKLLITFGASDKTSGGLRKIIGPFWLVHQ